MQIVCNDNIGFRKHFLKHLCLPFFNLMNQFFKVWISYFISVFQLLYDTFLNKVKWKEVSTTDSHSECDSDIEKKSSTFAMSLSWHLFRHIII